MDFKRLPRWNVSDCSAEEVARVGGRSYSPEATVERVWPFLSLYGVTRLARQTDLDRIGIPCWAAFRPAARTLAAAQGKGLSDAAACASAAMEAIEVAAAESPYGETHLTTAATLTRDETSWLSPQHLLPIGTQFDLQQELYWRKGRELLSGETIWVPSDALDLSPRSDLAGICKSSNGLASGNTVIEASFHGVCELVERDAATLWGLDRTEDAVRTCFAAPELSDPIVDYLVKRVEDAGLRVKLFDLTSDIGIPVVMAVIGPGDASSATELEITAGYGAHPVGAYAAIRAITEAAQSRVTSIAASRDDIHSASFKTVAPGEWSILLAAEPASKAPLGLVKGKGNSDLLLMALTRLREVGCALVVAELGLPDVPFKVVRVLSVDLEDRDANANWRPGWRSFEHLERR